MSGKIYDRDGHIYFQPEEDYEFLLDEDNTNLDLHRRDSLYDRFAIQDPLDKEWWSWWRYDSEEETFTYFEQVACTVGRVVLRETVTEDVRAHFERRHTLTDDDYEHLLEDS